MIDRREYSTKPTVVKELDQLIPGRPVAGYPVEEGLADTDAHLVFVSRPQDGASVVVKLWRSQQPFVDQWSDSAVDKQRRAAFLTEGVVPIVDAGKTELDYLDRNGVQKTGAFNFSVTPYFHDGTLYDSIYETPIDLRQRLKGLAHAGTALDIFGQQGGIVHRDFKPGNLLMLNGQANVNDFEYAVNAGEEINRDNSPVGTRGYMPPQQLLPFSRLDHRANVWSAGATALAVVSQQSGLYGASSASEKAYGTKLNMRLRGVPWPVQTYLRDWMAYNPDNRPNTFMEIFDDFARAAMNPKSSAVIFRAGMHFLKG